MFLHKKYEKSIKFCDYFPYFSRIIKENFYQSKNGGIIPSLKHLFRVLLIYALVSFGQENTIVF
jgi:hypothetical protein